MNCGSDWRKAVELLSEYRQSGDVTLSEFNAAITVCGRCRHSRKALEMLVEMKACGVKPNVVTFSKLINACGKDRQWKKALEVLNSMKDENGVTPNKFSFNAAISACEKGGQWEKALELLESMECQGVTPDVVSFNAAISACENTVTWVPRQTHSPRRLQGESALKKIR